VKNVSRENVATVLVDPLVLEAFELELMTLDLLVWPVSTAPICVDGPRVAFQTRRRLLMAHRGDWDLAAGWTPVWVSFGASWRDGDEPLAWAAHETLWRVLASYGSRVRFHRRLGSVNRLQWPESVRP
jgi:hypothetical protein